MYAAADVEGVKPHDLAQAAQRVHRAAGSPRRRFVLALGHGLYQHRLMVLPVLPKREMDEVLRRKAANLLGCEIEDALFAALEFRPERAADATHDKAAVEAALESRWLLVAMRRSEIVPLLHHLRECGLSVRRMVASGLSILCAAQCARSDRTQACIAVSIERTSVSVGLMDGAVLIQHNVLQGNFSSTPSLALALLQEIKSCEAFWRKTSRGGSVAEVVLVGVPRSRADLFENAVHAALPRAKITRLGAEMAIRAELESATLVTGENATPVTGAEANCVTGAEPAEVAGHDRAELLAACVEGGDFQIDLTLRLPIPQRTAVWLSAVAVLVTGALGAVTYGSVENHRARLENEARSFAAEAADLAEIRSRRARAEESLEILAAYADRCRAIQHSGYPLDTEIDFVLSAFGQEASLHSLALGRLDQGGEVEIRGATVPHPWRAVQNVKRITSSLAHSGLFSNLSAEPGGSPSNEGGASADRPTSFTIKARSSAAVPAEDQP